MENIKARIEAIEAELPNLSAQMIQSEEWKKNRRIKLFNDRHFHAKYLIKKNPNGTYNYEAMIAYIHFLEEARKDLAAIHQAYELAKRWHIENENIEARERIKEEDKKYVPKKVSSAETKASKSGSKMSPEDKKIANLIKLGLTEEAARSILGIK